jgi:hypothetical protein
MSGFSFAAFVRRLGAFQPFLAAPQKLGCNRAETLAMKMRRDCREKRFSKSDAKTTPSDIAAT